MGEAGSRANAFFRQSAIGPHLRAHTSGNRRKNLSYGARERDLLQQIDFTLLVQARVVSPPPRPPPPRGQSRQRMRTAQAVQRKHLRPTIYTSRPPCANISCANLEPAYGGCLRKYSNSVSLTLGGIRILKGRLKPARHPPPHPTTNGKKRVREGKESRGERQGVGGWGEEKTGAGERGRGGTKEAPRR